MDKEEFYRYYTENKGAVIATLLLFSRIDKKFKKLLKVINYETLTSALEYLKFTYKQNKELLSRFKISRIKCLNAIISINQEIFKRQLFVNSREGRK